VEHHGYSGSYDAVKRFIRKLRKSNSKISCRFEIEPGQEMQVDYGEGALTRDPRTGKYRRPRLFTLTLSNSRHAFQKAVWNSSTEIWCRLHEDGFAYFGGTAHSIRFDNLKEGVIKPDVYDPQLNVLYAKLLEHYDVVPLPCRPYAPDLKGKVESAVGYVQKTALKGKRFESIEEQNANLARWNERWAATRIHGTTKRQVRAMFDEERPFLQPLPTRFEYYRICQRTVHFDGYIEVDSAYYSAPPRYIGQKVVTHVGALCVSASLTRQATNAFGSIQSRCTKGSDVQSTPIGPSKHRSRSSSSLHASPAPDPAAKPLRISLSRTAAPLPCGRSTGCSTYCAVTKHRPWTGSVRLPRLPT
jgi:transposase